MLVCRGVAVGLYLYQEKASCKNFLADEEKNSLSVDVKRWMYSDEKKFVNLVDRVCWCAGVWQ